jgi:glycosyltransferase involved in cell wall biosynthesis
MTPRICVVSALYHPDLGGLGRQAQLLSERLRKEGVELFVIARKMGVDGTAKFSPDVEVIRVPSLFPKHHILEEISIRNILISVIFSLGCLVVLIRRRKSYDLVHFHGASIPLFVALPYLKWTGKKVVAKVAAANLGTEAGSLSGRYGGVGSLLASLVRQVDAFVAISEEIREGLIRDGISQEKIHDITNFIDLDIFRPSTSEEKIRLKDRFGYSNKMLLLFAGRLVPRKGLPYLLEIWKEVSPDFPNARLLILGDGPLSGDLFEMAVRLNISDTVHFGGRVGNVPDYLRAADVFVLPSLQEGMANALLEAMASGLPAVASRIGGVVDVVEDGKNALLVDPTDRIAFLEILRKMLTNEELRIRLSQNALETIRASYGLEARVSSYIELYEQL